MKIAIDGRFYGLEHGGLGRYTKELVNNISKTKSANKYYLLLRKKYFKTLKLPKNWEKILVDYKHYTLAEQINLPQIIKKINPDITHFLHFNVPLFTPKPYMVTIHDMIMHKSKGVDATTLSSYQYLVKRVGYRLVFKNAVKRASRIITPSIAVKNDLVDYFKINSNKIHTIHMGIDESFFDDKKTIKKRNYFLYVGSAYPHKNLLQLIKVVKKEKYKLIIVSSRNVFTKRLQKSIKKLNAKKYIELVGYVNDKELKSLYTNATAFVYPSLLEGFGLQGLEAMARKTLLAVSNTKVFKEIYKDNAIYFNPKSVESISQSLKQIIDMDISEIEKKLQKAQKYAKTFTWQKTAQKTLSLYYNIYSK